MPTNNCLSIWVWPYEAYYELKVAVFNQRAPYIATSNQEISQEARHCVSVYVPLRGEDAFRQLILQENVSQGSRVLIQCPPIARHQNDRRKLVPRILANKQSAHRCAR